ncbi:MAG: hypothetical protein RLY70_4035, partial [Planctomycetota bacterium]
PATIAESWTRRRWPTTTPPTAARSGRAVASLPSPNGRRDADGQARPSHAEPRPSPRRAQAEPRPSPRRAQATVSRRPRFHDGRRVVKLSSDAHNPEFPFTPRPGRGTAIRDHGFDSRYRVTGKFRGNQATSAGFTFRPHSIVFSPCLKPLIRPLAWTFHGRQDCPYGHHV